MHTTSRPLFTRSFLYIRPSINHHGPNFAIEVNKRTNVKAYFFRVQKDILARYKDDRGPFTERSACRDAPQLKSWSYRCVLSPSKKLGGRCERFLSVKVYALKELKDFVQRSFRLPNTRGAHVSQDIVFHFYNNDDFRLKYKRDFIVSRKQTRICRIYTIVVAVSSVAVVVGSPRSLSAFDESSRSHIHVLSDST